MKLDIVVLNFSTNYIRVLDLGKSSFKKLPSSIARLKLLRYLNALGIQDRLIPSCITRLSKLIYFSLRGSSRLLALPESFGKMEALMYLDLSGCEEIKKLPEPFGKLGNLIHLDLSSCDELNGIPEALCSLAKLQHLNLSRCDRLLSGSKGLHEVISKLTKLQYLNLSRSVSNSLKWNYVFEKMESSVLIDSVINKISTLSNLEHLNLSGENFVALPDSFCSLRRLHTLDLTGSMLKELPPSMDRMDSLKFLIGNNCQTMPINKRLIPLPNFVVHDVEGEQSSNLILLKDVNPTELELSRLENVKSIEEA